MQVNSQPDCCISKAFFLKTVSPKCERDACVRQSAHDRSPETPGNHRFNVGRGVLLPHDEGGFYECVIHTNVQPDGFFKMAQMNTKQIQLHQIHFHLIPSKAQKHLLVIFQAIVW